MHILDFALFAFGLLVLILVVGARIVGAMPVRSLLNHRRGRTNAMERHEASVMTSRPIDQPRFTRNNTSTKYKL
jgi:hypothetical protein